MHSVLIIDDAEDILDFATISFDLREWETYTADNGNEGLLIASKLNPQLVLLDYDLGAETGLEVLSRFQAAPATAQIPVIFLTGSDSPEERQRYLDAGAVGVLSKPFDPMTLADRAIDLLQNLGYKV